MSDTLTRNAITGSIPETHGARPVTLDSYGIAPHTLNLLPEAAAVLRQDRIIAANTMLADMLVVENAADLIGRSMLLFMDSEETSGLSEQLQVMMAQSNEHMRRCMTLKCADGTRRNVQISGRVLWDPDHRSPVVLAQITDLADATVFEHTRSMQLYQELEVQNRMLEEVVAISTAELSKAAEWNWTILNAVGEAIVVLDDNGLIQQVNPAFEEQTGYRAQDVHLKKCYTALHHDSAEHETLQRALEQTRPGKPTRTEVHLQRKDGTLYDAALTLTAVETQPNHLTFVCNLRDITAFKEIQRMKDALVSNVSHELRTPLSAVVLQLGTLNKYYERLQEDERRAMVADILNQATILVELINDILVLARFDAMQAPPAKQWFNLAWHFQEIVEGMQATAKEKSLIIHVDLPDTPCQTFGDPAQLGRVFRNIYGNAIKYTPNGGSVSVSMDWDKTWTTLSVTDTGIGIPLEDQSNIFERFYRSAAASKIASGSGLGLAICQEIIQLHDGDIAVKSAPGQGSTFTVRIPRGMENGHA